MSNLKRKPQSELSIYDPECVVYSPEVIINWIETIAFKPGDYERYADKFLILIAAYCVEENGKLPGPPAFWQRNVLSYSFFFGLGITIFDREFAKNLLYGLTEGWSRCALLWLNEVWKSDHEDNTRLWAHAVNVLSAQIAATSPETVGPNANEKLVKQRAIIAGFTPAIRLGLNNPELAQELFEGAVDEREDCDDENLIGRINWIRSYIADAWDKNKARHSN
jgi:hypothetical protein